MDVNTGAIIKEYRIKRHMSLAELCNRVGVGASTVRKWEIGYIKDMRSDKIEKVAEALGISPAQLMGWPEATPKGATVLSVEEAELLRIYQALDGKARLRLLTTAMKLESEAS